MTTPSLNALPATEVLVVADCWTVEADAEAIIHRAIEAAASMVDADTGDAELAIMLTDDAGIRTLNQNWRGIDKPTNVLSFPAGAHGSGHLGDIALAFGVCDEEARAQGKPLANHLRHLVIHGVLHLLGYDHQRDDEAARMESIERDLLASMNIPDPYEQLAHQVDDVRRRR